MRLPALIGWTGLLVYVTWNTYWIVVYLRLPPSLFLTITGLPAPSTGMTRSFYALLRGDIAGSLFWNPFTIPFCLLFLYSLSYAACYLLGRCKPLGRWFLFTWLTLLLGAWLTKFVIGPDSW